MFFGINSPPVIVPTTIRKFVEVGIVSDAGGGSQPQPITIEGGTVCGDPARFV